MSISPPTRITGLSAVLLACAGMAGCTSSADDAPDLPVRIVASGGTHGWIVPCGCSFNQSGGMPRRGSFFKQYAGKEHLVYVDTGGAPRGRSEYSRVKFEAILQGERELGIIAHNVGAEELVLGVDYLLKTSKEIGVPFLASNLYMDRKSPFEQVIRLNRGGLQMAIIGLLDDTYVTIGGNGIELVPPEQTLREQLASGKLREKSDLLVVLAYMPDDKLRELAEQFPEIDLFIGGPDHPVPESVSQSDLPPGFGADTSLEGQPIPPTRLGPTILLSATNKGKFLAVLELSGSHIRHASIVELNDKYTDDATQLKVLGAYYDRLQKADMTPESSQLIRSMSGVASEAKIDGSKSCQTCHEEEYEVWHNSSHASAWQSLKKGRAWVDPACQSCHTTGYGLTGGFRSVGTTINRTNVGCESCHGPSAAHVADPETVKTATAGRAQNACVICHDHENSPHFDYEKYWKKIDHKNQ